MPNVFTDFRAWIISSVIGWLLLTPTISGQDVVVVPTKVQLSGQGSRQRLLVSVNNAGRTMDRTRAARYISESPGVATVSETGLVTAIGTGRGRITVTVGDTVVPVDVDVQRGDQPLSATFESDIQPILARAGCNSGPCHGKARGQNGFQLSLLGYDSQFDFEAIVHEARGRRLFPASPAKSLFLTKPTGEVPHGGGKKLAVGDANYEILRRWIETGTPRTPSDAPTVSRITVEPAERRMSFREEQQLAVTAHMSDGTSRDVTHLTMFQSSESVIAPVTPDGLVKTGPLPGEVAIMARFQEKFAVATILIPQPTPVPNDVYAALPRKNFIDEHVWNKLKKLNIVPSESATDATFLRRATLDVLGRLPTIEEAKAFLSDTKDDRRERLIDSLLERPEYADYWANQWADLLRPNPYRVGIKSVMSLDTYLRDSFRENKPFDRFAREIIAAQGSTWRNGATVVFRDRRSPDEIATLISQLFLGVRLECAKCHHHPFEVWSQDDFFSLAAYFAKIGRKGTGLSPPISGGEEVVFHSDKGEVKHPVTGVTLPPRPLFGSAPVDEDDDPRRALATWIVSDNNPYFAKVAVNRVWAELMGRGIVDPVDDLRATNPPSNGPLLDALADHFRREKYDFKKLLRTIMTSHVYGLSATPVPGNMADLRNYSRHYRQRLRAEVLLDAVGDVTGVRDKFAVAPAGTRAMALWTVRTESFFLDAFSRPDPNQDPPCERSPETSVVQALHLMNSPALHGKITSDQGRAADLAASKRSPEEIIDEIYLSMYSRRPDEKERAICRTMFENTPRRQAVEDLMWTLINTPEFVMKN